ncbi:MAG: hypothetical protein LBL79_08095 [Prevotella sp.]|jgi:hypothetical protein|nr:hypothetical protein [Prevotella sp.]
MDIQQFYQFIQKDAVANRQEAGSLRELIEKYPYFQAAIFAYLKSLYANSDDGYKNELERLSIAINDRRALFYYIFSEEYDGFFAQTGKKEINEDKTGILLNAFFESRDDETSELEYSISHSSLASTDYLSYAQSEEALKLTGYASGQEDQEETVNLKHQSIIDSFINKSEEGKIRIRIKEKDKYEAGEERNGEENEEELTEDVFFTETLAKIYIKQKKYEKAYKIIKHLSLNYPKKNIYFADQLSFLEKLIINTKHKDKK